MTTSTGKLSGFDVTLLIISDYTIREIQIIQLVAEFNVDGR